MPETKLRFKLGSDPEFSFILQGRRVNACELLDANLLRKKGFYKKNYGFDCEGGQIGWDGCNATAELRPKPSNSINEIIKNIKSILVETHKYLPTFDMTVLSTFAPVGGHIHFEITRELHENPRKVQLVHKKLSSFYLPILISENKINLRLRSGDTMNNQNGSGFYGSLTDFHSDNQYQRPDGGYDFTYEFRTPSAEWLISEKICEATFAYLATVYNEILFRPENFKEYMDIVYKNNEQAIALHRLAVTNFVGITEGVFERIKKAVRTFELYPEFKEQIEYILNPKKVVSDKKAAGYNIVDGWNLPKAANIRKPKLKEIVNEKRFKEQAAKIDLDKQANLMNISYNDDINVNLFVHSLAERSAAFNWKLKNSYFLFGMKKGINQIIAFNQDYEILAGKEIIKTTSDASAMDHLMKRILKKFVGVKSKTIDPITGELEKTKSVVIGLPYELRINKKPKELIKLVYRLEENKIKPEKVESNLKNLHDDMFKSEQDKGEFHKYVYGIKKEDSKEEVPGVVFDENSQGHQIAERNSNRIIQSEIRDEENNSEEEPEEQESMLHPSYNPEPILPIIDGSNRNERKNSLEFLRPVQYPVGLNPFEFRPSDQESNN
jgi:hypothetical protein